jgi:hypothetical protein
MATTITSAAFGVCCILLLAADNKILMNLKTCFTLAQKPEKLNAKVGTQLQRNWKYGFQQKHTQSRARCV